MSTLIHLGVILSISGAVLAMQIFPGGGQYKVTKYMDITVPFSVCSTESSSNGVVNWTVTLTKIDDVQGEITLARLDVSGAARGRDVRGRHELVYDTGSFDQGFDMAAGYFRITNAHPSDAGRFKLTVLLKNPQNRRIIASQGTMLRLEVLESHSTEPLDERLIEPSSVAVHFNNVTTTQDSITRSTANTAEGVSLVLIMCVLYWWQQFYGINVAIL